MTWIKKISIIIDLWFLGYCFKHDRFKNEIGCYNCQMEKSTKLGNKNDNIRNDKLKLVEEYKNFKSKN